MNAFSRLCLITLSLFSLSVAADDVLYGKVPPADAAFFRFVNASSEKINVSFEDKVIANLSPREISRFGFNSEGTIEFKLNEVEFNATLKKGEHATIVLNSASPSDVKIIKETEFDNKRKARVKLYNLTDNNSVELKTADGKHSVVKPVASFNVGFRDVNAVKMPFATFTGDDKVTSTDPIALARDKVTSIFAFNFNQSAYIAIAETDR